MNTDTDREPLTLLDVLEFAADIAKAALVILLAIAVIGAVIGFAFAKFFQ